MKRSKILALLASLALTVGVVGIAFANDLSVDKPNQVNTSFDDLISEEGVDEDCTDFDPAPGEGEVGIHFILTQPEGDSGNITVTVDGTTYGPIAGEFHGNSENGAMHFYVIVDGDGDSEVSEATTDVDGNNLTISHLCFGEAEPTPTPDEPTPTPTFSGGGEDLTEPPTDTFGGNGTSNPADSAWLLVVALGVLLASIVVLTPARAKGRR
jgi:hypothetical protein